MVDLRERCPLRTSDLNDVDGDIGPESSADLELGDGIQHAGKTVAVMCRAYGVGDDAAVGGRRCDAARRTPRGDDRDRAMDTSFASQRSAVPRLVAADAAEERDRDR